MEYPRVVLHNRADRKYFFPDNSTLGFGPCEAPGECLVDATA
jgi:hypothetical protein